MRGSIKSSAPISSKEIAALAKVAASAFEGEAWLYERLHSMVLEHNKAIFDTSGRAGGEPWDQYTSEPKYKAYKVAVTGHLKVGRWLPGKEYLYPALTSADSALHVASIANSVFALGAKVDYLQSFVDGGTNQFGESYPARKFGVPDTVLDQWRGELLALAQAQLARHSK